MVSGARETIGMPRITLIKIQALQDPPTGNLILITALLLHFPHMHRRMTKVGMTRRLGVAVHIGNELHLGQKPKLGGRYTDIVHLYTHHIWSALCISIFCIYFLLDLLDVWRYFLVDLLDF